MSLLADLLSKNKAGSSHGVNETPSQLNVPPTLSKALGNQVQVRKFDKRYIIVSVALAMFIALGWFVMLKTGALKASAKKNVTPPPQAVQAPVQPKAELTTPAPPQATVTPPPAAAQPAEQVKTARISLEEPPAPAPAKHLKPHKALHAQPAPRQSVSKVTAAPKPPAQLPAQQVERPTPQAVAQPRQKPGAPLKIDTAARDSYLYAARSAEQISDWKSALASYRKALEIDPGDYKIMSNVAAALNNLGMFDDGVQEAERALEKKPDYVPALINAAIGHSSKGNTQKALRLFTYANVLDPSNRSLIINLGILHERSGNLDDALATYRPLANSCDSMVLQGLGRVYERKGNKAEAIRVYRQLMALPNINPAIKKETKRKLARLEE
jgi:Flp pilus assembly protein TadD